MTFSRRREPSGPQGRGVVDLAEADSPMHWAVESAGFVGVFRDGIPSDIRKRSPVR